MDNWKNEEPELSPPVNAAEVSYVLVFYCSDSEELDNARCIDQTKLLLNLWGTATSMLFCVLACLVVSLYGVTVNDV